MLTTRRQGARLAPLLTAIPSPAFAESSKQAELRASRPAPTLGGRQVPSRNLSAGAGRYSAAAVANHPSSDDPARAVPVSSGALPGSTTRRPGFRSPSAPSTLKDPLPPNPPKFPKPRPQSRAEGTRRDPDLDAGHRRYDGPYYEGPRSGDPPPWDGRKPTGAERFRRRLEYDPLGALLWLPDLHMATLDSITKGDLKTMIYNITAYIQPSPQLRREIDHDRGLRALRIVRALLMREPHHRKGKVPAKPAVMGASLKGGKLRGLFRLGILVGVNEFVAELFAERMAEQIRTGHDIVNTEHLAMDLAAGNEWQLAADLFPGPESNHPTAKYAPQIGDLPADMYTPRLIAIVMTANIVVKQPWRAVKLHSLLGRGEASAEAHCALIQAHLQLGDIAEAKQAVYRANAAGVDEDAIQLALLRGHRMLGFDGSLEERLRQDLSRLGLAPRLKLANALGWLCVDSDNLVAADKILVEIRELERTGQVASDSPDLTETALLTLAVTSRSGDVDRTKQAWSFFERRRPAAVTDNVVAHLCRALIRLGKGQDGARVLQAAVLHDPAQSPWPIPPSYVPGILTGNTVLRAACASGNYRALLDVLTLMRVGGIVPDKHTVILALTFAKSNLLSSPVALAKLLEGILERTGDSPTVEQINVILSEIIRIATSPQNRQVHLAGEKGSHDGPTAGIETRGQVRNLLMKQIAVLQSSSQPSTGTSLSNRLLYDALAVDGVWPVQAVQKTWQSFVLRGFRPTAHHYLTLIMAYTRIGAMTEAEETFALATSSNSRTGTATLSPPVVREMLTALLSGWAHASNLDAARRVYDRIRNLPCGVDATALDAIVNAHVLADKPGRGVSFARDDIASVLPNERLVVTVAHALRRNNDAAAAIFFVSHFTVRRDDQAGPGTDRDGPFDSQAPAPGAHWELTPKLLAVVRKALNYLAKRPTETADERTREAILLGNHMLEDDVEARPWPRGKRRLNSRTRHRITDAVDITRSDRVTAAHVADERRALELKEAEKAEKAEIEEERRRQREQALRDEAEAEADASTGDTYGKEKAKRAAKKHSP